MDFELNRMIHKPKLVAVTDCSGGAGASTLAGGLAAALSETGDGKVLLVDMNVRRPEVHSFFRGAPACSLTEALVGAPSPAGENLYLAVATSPDAPEAPVIPKKFYDLMPHLKASDFDYIIFDMPPIGPNQHHAAHVSLHGQSPRRGRGREDQSRFPQAQLRGTSHLASQRVGYLQQSPFVRPEMARSFCLKGCESAFLRGTAVLAETSEASVLGIALERNR